MKRNNISRVLIIIGALLIVSAVGLLVFRNVFISSSISKAESVVATLAELVPQVNDATFDDRKNTDMPAAQIDGSDYIGMLEAKDFQIKLPICSNGRQPESKSMPYRYSGSIYDGSLVLGGEDYKGQFEFLTKIDERHLITITDLDGNRYTYKMIFVERMKNCNTDTLDTAEADLTLFSKNTSSRNWIVAKFKML